jgi:riboflavin biosynthesis pyrimidine reductase
MAHLHLSDPQLNHYPPPPNAEPFTGEPVQLVQKLSKEGVKSRKFKRESVWVMGGPLVRSRMLELGVVERVEVVMVPRIMKSAGGVPLWSFGDSENEEGSRSVELELIDTRSYENGVVSLSYAVLNN